MSEAWRRRTERQYAELEIDALVNARWNSSAVPETHAVDTFDAYLTWTLEVYDHLDGDEGSPLDWERPDRSVLDAVGRALDAVELARIA